MRRMRKLFRDGIFFRGYPIYYIHMYISRVVGINGAFARARSTEFLAWRRITILYGWDTIGAPFVYRCLLLSFSLSFKKRVIAVVAAARDPVRGFRSPEARRKRDRRNFISPRYYRKFYRIPLAIKNLCSLRSSGFETNAKFRIGRLVGNR